MAITTRLSTTKAVWTLPPQPLCLLTQLADMEPFDEALDRRIWSLADTRLQWHRRIAETRRNVPLELGTSISSILDQQRVNDPEITEPSNDLGEEVLLKTGGAHRFTLFVAQYK